jgi:hypothetical protein
MDTESQDVNMDLLFTHNELISNIDYSLRWNYPLPIDLRQAIATKYQLQYNMLKLRRTA